MEIETLKMYIDSIIKLKFNMNNFSELIDYLNSDDIFKQHYGVIGIRKILSVGINHIKLQYSIYI